MVDIQSVAAEIRRGKQIERKRRRRRRRRKKPQGKNIMPALLHTAAIITVIHGSRCRGDLLYNHTVLPNQTRNNLNGF